MEVFRHWLRSEWVPGDSWPGSLWCCACCGREALYRHRQPAAGSGKTVGRGGGEGGRGGRGREIDPIHPL